MCLRSIENGTRLHKSYRIMKKKRKSRSRWSFFLCCCACACVFVYGIDRGHQCVPEKQQKNKQHTFPNVGKHYTNTNVWRAELLLEDRECQHCWFSARLKIQLERTRACLYDKLWNWKMLEKNTPLCCCSRGTMKQTKKWPKTIERDSVLGRLSNWLKVGYTENPASPANVCSSPRKNFVCVWVYV